MRRLKILVGHVSEEFYTDGSQSFNDSVIRGLREVADISLVVTNYWGNKSEGPIVEEIKYAGLSAIMIRPRTKLAFDLRKSAPTSEVVAEGRFISQEIAHFAIKQKVDIFHILQWAHLRGCLFEAALQAKIPFVHTPYEYWAVCPQYFLLQNNNKVCSGPDNYGRKCYSCIHNQIMAPYKENKTVNIPYKIPKRNFIEKLPFRLRNLLNGIITSEVCMRIFGPSWSPLFGSVYEGQWEITMHLRALRYYLSRAECILPMTTFWGKELALHLRIPIEKFRICSPGSLDRAKKLPKGDRFKLPLQFGHPHRVHFGSGSFFVLEAWRKAGITPSEGILHLYGKQGDLQFLQQTIYADLIAKGSVKVHEERIADRLDEIFMPLAAVITGYQWKIGACGHGGAIARGIPNISSRWDHGSEEESLLKDGVNAILYTRWDSDSLAEVLQRCVANPSVLEKIYDTCEPPQDCDPKKLIEKYLQVYDEIIT